MEKNSVNFTNLASLILKRGTRGPERREFLSEISAEILSYSGFQTIEVRSHDDELHYRWIKNSDGTEPVYCRIDSDLADRSDTSLLETVRRSIVLGRVPEQYEPYFTHHGTFFFHSPDDPLWSGSLVILPLRRSEPSAEGTLLGIVELRSPDPGLLTAHSVDLLEFLALLLGWAISTRRSQLQLRERVKELTCLYSVSHIAQRRDATLDSLFQEILRVIPPGFQYPDEVRAAILVDARKYQADGFDKCSSIIRAPLFLEQRQRGEIRVGSIHEGIHGVESTFLPEEKNLIEALSREIEVLLERHAFEEEKRRLESQLRHADRLSTVGELSAGVAHELNEPLSDILGFTQLIGDEQALPDHVRADLHHIEKATLRMREVVRELLTFARKLPAGNDDVNINSLIRETADFLNGRFRTNGIELILDLQDTLSIVPGDSAQIQQVLMNILVNAVQAMPEGGTITVATKESVSRVKVSVQDTGIGMDQETLSKIFNPFFTTKETGTGLGLAIASDAVQKNDGRIRVYSRPGQGSTFTIYLPRVHAE